MVQADLLCVLPDDSPWRKEVLKIFTKQAEGSACWQSESGLWQQLLDKNDSYLETSVSAMFVFKFTRGINCGWRDQDFSNVEDIGC